MQFQIIAFLLIVTPFAFAISAYSNEDSEILSNNERFARDLEARKKFAFAFAKRANNDEPPMMLDPRGSHHDNSMRFAFAKRSAPKEFARFARASFA